MDDNAALLDVGLCSVAFRKLAPPEVIDVARRAGIGHIEWGGDVHVAPGDVAIAREVRDLTHAAGIRVASYGSYLRAGLLGNALEHQTSAVLDTAVAIGATNLRVWAIGSGAAPELAAVCAMAQDRDITVSLEFHPGTATETASQTNALLDEVGASNLFTYWQPDPTLSHDRQLDELRAVRDRLSHVHVFSWEPNGTRLPLSAQESPWRAAIAAVIEASPPSAIDPRVAFCEFVRGDDPEQLMADATSLRSWIAEAA